MQVKCSESKLSLTNTSSDTSVSEEFDPGPSICPIEEFDVGPCIITPSNRDRLAQLGRLAQLQLC